MRFRTRTQEVEAVEYTGDNAHEVMSICTAASAHSDGKGNEWIEILDRFKRRVQVHDPVILVHTDDKPAGWYIADREWFERTFPIPVRDLIRTVEDYEGLPDLSIIQVNGPARPLVIQKDADRFFFAGDDQPCTAKYLAQRYVCSVVRLGGEQGA